MERLVVFAKSPRLHGVKTRLALTFGSEPAPEPAAPAGAVAIPAPSSKASAMVAASVTRIPLTNSETMP